MTCDATSALQSQAVVAIVSVLTAWEYWFAKARGWMMTSDLIMTFSHFDALRCLFGVIQSAHGALVRPKIEQGYTIMAKTIILIILLDFSL